MFLVKLLTRLAFLLAGVTACVAQMNGCFHESFNDYESSEFFSGCEIQVLPLWIFEKYSPGDPQPEVQTSAGFIMADQSQRCVANKNLLNAVDGSLLRINYLATSVPTSFVIAFILNGVPDLKFPDVNINIWSSYDFILETGDYSINILGITGGGGSLIIDSVTYVDKPEDIDECMFPASTPLTSSTITDLTTETYSTTVTDPSTAIDTTNDATIEISTDAMTETTKTDLVTQTTAYVETDSTTTDLVTHTTTSVETESTTTDHVTQTTIDVETESTTTDHVTQTTTDVETESTTTDHVTQTTTDMETESTTTDHVTQTTTDLVTLTTTDVETKSTTTDHVTQTTTDVETESTTTDHVTQTTTDVETESTTTYHVTQTTTEAEDESTIDLDNDVGVNLLIAVIALSVVSSILFITLLGGSCFLLGKSHRKRTPPFSV